MYLLCDLTTETRNKVTIKKFIFNPFYSICKKKNNKNNKTKQINIKVTYNNLDSNGYAPRVTHVEYEFLPFRSTLFYPQF